MNTTTSHPTNSLPSFDELPVHEGTGLAHAWEVLHHDFGTLSLLGTEQTLKGAATVIDGEVFSLNLPINFPDPPLFGRKAMEHQMYAVDRNTRDERIDGFYPQASSQWDGLRHVRAREFGFFGGYNDEFAPGDGGPLGIERWAERGIAGRAVLLDFPRYREAAHVSYDALCGEPITADELQSAADQQDVRISTGDILCIRTGWLAAYRQLDEAGRRALSADTSASGLQADAAMASWLWDQHVSAVAVDNPAVEVIPGNRDVGSLHRRLIPMLGFALAELLDFDALARACASDGRREFLFVSAPLNVPGGLGSTANALAMR